MTGSLSERRLRPIRCLALVCTLLLPALAEAQRTALPSTFRAEQVQSVQVPAAGTLEVAFSPSNGGEALVLKVVNSATTDIRILAYSFTSAPLVRALLHAHKRGVAIRLLVDHNSNVRDDRSGKARAALSTLATAGISVRTIGAYAIHHDKVIIVDGQTVELGSYNYSDAAARRNSENVFVNWRNPALAGVYLAHFERNDRLAVDYRQPY